MAIAKKTWKADGSARNKRERISHRTRRLHGSLVNLSAAILRRAFTQAPSRRSTIRAPLCTLFSPKRWQLAPSSIHCRPSSTACSSQSHSAASRKPSSCEQGRVPSLDCKVSEAPEHFSKAQIPPRMTEFYGCYLLVSNSERGKGRTYIG